LPLNPEVLLALVIRVLAAQPVNNVAMTPKQMMVFKGDANIDRLRLI